MLGMQKESKNQQDLLINSLTLRSLANKELYSLRDENDEPIYTYNDELKRNFVRQSIKRGHCSTLNQFYRSAISDEVFNINSKELNVNGNVCEILDEYFVCTKKHGNITEND